MTCAPSEDSDQFDKSLRCPGKKPCLLSYPLSAQRSLIRLGGCPGSSESSLGANVISLFFHDVAHFLGYILIFCVCFTTEVKFITTKDIPIRTIKIYELMAFIK